MAGYSKGARGLFVLMREIGILTDTAVSPSLRRRQPSSRYAIHAGRNLPDKEFRSVVPAPFPEGPDFTLTGGGTAGPERQVSEGSRALPGLPCGLSPCPPDSDSPGLRQASTGRL